MRQLTDAELLIYIDGAADAEIAAQVERSPELKARAQALAQQQAMLRAGLHRADCPDPLTLAEFKQGLLRSEQVLLVRAHVVNCPHCTRELAELADFLAPQPGLIERARLIIAQLVSGGDGQAGLAFGLRGGDHLPRTFSAGDSQIILTIQTDVRRPAIRALAGLLVGVEAVGVEARLMAGSELIATTPVNEMGDFIFSNVKLGAYTLLLVTPVETIQIPEFQIE